MMLLEEQGGLHSGKQRQRAKNNGEGTVESDSGPVSPRFIHLAADWADCCCMDPAAHMNDLKHFILLATPFFPHFSRTLTYSHTSTQTHTHTHTPSHKPQQLIFCIAFTVINQHSVFYLH